MTYIMVTDHGDRSADVTIVDGEDDHRFSVSADDDTALVSYEESNSWLGQIRVGAPREEVWRTLMQSDEMTEFVEENDMQKVRRDRR